MFSEGLGKMLQGERVHRSCSQKRSEPLMHKLISQELAQIPQMIGSQSRHAASKAADRRRYMTQQRWETRDR